VVSVTDRDHDDANTQVSYSILPSPHSHLFTIRERGQECDVILTDQLDADVASNASVATVIYSLQVCMCTSYNGKLH